MEDNVAPVLFFSGFVLGNFFCAVAMTILRRLKGPGGSSGRGRRTKGFPFRLPPFLMLDPKGVVTGYYWLQPAFATSAYSSAVPVGEMLSFGKNSGLNKKK
jgi:hypothetical protein